MSSEGPTRPARPHHRFTEDGRRIREVLSYSRRGSRFTPQQAEAWAAHHDAWVIPDEAVDDPGFDLGDWFGREAPLIVEIGSGVGEATGALAAARPAYDVLALEVWRPGVASSLAQVAAAGATNVRFCSVDAEWPLDNQVRPDGLAEQRPASPRPCPKTRHHKRRLVDQRFAALAATRLASGARWRLATDWVDYADQMVSVLDAQTALTGGIVPRWEERPVTKFERKGIEAGRSITDLCYTRV
jgi:tRNA (guanine-N7-)-methyltransferase